MKSIQQKIISEMKTNPTINPKEEIRKSIDFIKKYVKTHSFIKTLVLGISGGQDSTLVGKLAQLAINELNEENNIYQFIAIRLPYGKQIDEADCQEAIKFINPDKVFTVNIKNAVDKSLESFREATGEELSDFLKGNTKARERMKVQYDIAGHFNGIVLGTDHSAESITGFYTKFGDGACDIAPIFRLNKRQGKALLKELNCPENLYNKQPTADLEDNKPQLPDEEALGVTYDEIDDYLEGKEIEEESALRIENLYQQTQHKRHLPITIFDKLQI